MEIGVTIDHVQGLEQLLLVENIHHFLVVLLVAVFGYEQRHFCKRIFKLIAFG